MTAVTYTGSEDVRELAAADLKKAGVEGFSARKFNRGESIEVSPEVAEALIGRSDLFGSFEATSTDTELDVPEADVVDTSTPSETDPTTTTTTRRSSTRTR